MKTNECLLEEREVKQLEQHSTAAMRTRENVEVEERKEGEDDKGRSGHSVRVAIYVIEFNKEGQKTKRIRKG